MLFFSLCRFIGAEQRLKKRDVKSSSKETDFLLKINKPKITQRYERAAGVVVSCKIPILATRVRFPGGARLFFSFHIVAR